MKSTKNAYSNNQEDEYNSNRNTQNKSLITPEMMEDASILMNVNKSDNSMKSSYNTEPLSQVSEMTFSTMNPSQICYSQIDEFTDMNFEKNLDKDDNCNPSAIEPPQNIYSKIEMKQRMLLFEDSIPSTHIFLQTAQGTPNKWEHTPRRFFYVELLKPILSQSKSNISLCKCYQHLLHQYTNVTGTNTFPPFYNYNKSINRYVRMSVNEINT